MKIAFLGTCSGTEPIAGFHHASIAVEHEGAVYWFDAGERCSYTAHLMGLDLLAIRAIFISHTDMDHVGGLPNLLWNIRKLNSRLSSSSPLAGRTIRIFIPDLDVWRGAMALLGNDNYRKKTNYSLVADRFEDGTIYDESAFRVTALHNLHQGEPKPGEPWKSFSFRVDAGNTTLVYSGDVAGIGDVEPLLEGCGLLLMETGHHKVEEICRRISDSGRFSGKLVFVHHGRDILSDPEGELKKAKNILGNRNEVVIARDGMTLDV